MRIGDDFEGSRRQEPRRRPAESDRVGDSAAVRPDGDHESSELAQEARRQSLRVGGRRSETEALDFLEQAADTRGWE